MEKKTDTQTLTPEEKKIIIDKGTEKPFSGEYNDFYENGVYCCRQCGTMLYKSDSKFRSECGWPSFDDEVDGAVKRIPDPDGRRIEIVCAACNGHLGHVFEGERLTKKNVRHCVNSLSLRFIPGSEIGKAYFAGGCFWGVEYYFENKKGVLEAVSGYMGGNASDPDYKTVCTGTTGHAEVVEVMYNRSEVSYEELAKEFFEVHDPTQKNRQGPDIGTQYRSVIFVSDESERAAALKLIAELKENGYAVVTEVLPVTTFYRAENYHQNYFERAGKTPDCHIKTKRFK